MKTQEIEEFKEWLKGIMHEVIELEPPEKEAKFKTQGGKMKTQDEVKEMLYHARVEQAKWGRDLDETNRDAKFAETQIRSLAVKIKTLVEILGENE